MAEFHKLSELLTNEMDLFPKGNKVIIEKSGDWIMEIDSNWNSKRIDLNIKSRKSNLNSEFTYCSIKKAPFISLITRYDNYNITGKPSVISDYLLTNPLSLNLLKPREASFELNGKCLIYNCRINRLDKSSLSNIFKVLEKLNREITKLIDR